MDNLAISQPSDLIQIGYYWHLFCLNNPNYHDFSFVKDSVLAYRVFTAQVFSTINFHKSLTGIGLLMHAFEEEPWEFQRFLHRLIVR